MKSICIARNAMATRFEMLLYGADETHLRAAAETALDEIERLDAQLSLFNPGSDINRINTFADKQPVRLEPELFELLQRSAALTKETGGAFDITISPLIQGWGFYGKQGHRPEPDALKALLQHVGMQHVELDSKNHTIRFARAGMKLDMGAIGKGYALERAAALLLESGITSALIHGGTSTVVALGHPPGQDFWKVGIPRTTPFFPGREEAFSEHSQPESSTKTGMQYQSLGANPEGADPLILTGGGRADASDSIPVYLRDESLSVSGIWGKYFEQEGEYYGHILDPRTGKPILNAGHAVVILPSAMETDAFSTALLVLGRDWKSNYQSVRPLMRYYVAGGAEPGWTINHLHRME